MHCWGNNICDGEGKDSKDISVQNNVKIYLGNKFVLILIIKIFGRHVATDRMVSGAYKSEYGDSDEITQCLNEVEVSLFLLFENLY